MDETPKTTFGWMRRHRRGIAGSMLGMWFLPWLLLLGFALWGIGRYYPEWLAVVVLLVVFVLARVRRNRLRKPTADAG